LRILIDFAVDLSLKDLMGNLSQLIDEHTDYFKSHLDNLAAAERKVFIALLEIWDPIGAREVAIVSRMGVSQTSALLNRLVSRGAVMVVQQAKGRKKLYQAAERLYNIYYLMRRRSHPSSRVQGAVTFMVNFYQGEELVNVTTMLAREACLLAPGQRTDHYWVYHALVQTIVKPELKNKLFKATPDNFLNALDAPESLRQLASLQIDSPFEETYQVEERKFCPINEQFDSEPNKVVISSSDKALQIQPNDDAGWNNRGKALFNLGRYEEALVSYKNALEIQPNNYYSWKWYGLSLKNLNRYEEAITSFDKALELKPDKFSDFYHVWLNRACALHYLKRYEESVFSYDNALNIQPDSSYAWCWRATALKLLKRYEEAIASFDKALELKPDYHVAWLNRGCVLLNLGRYEDAITNNDRLLQFNPDCPDAWFNRGIGLVNLERYEEAIASYDKALKFKPNYPKVWISHGNALLNLERYEEAVFSYDKALQLSPDNPEAWINRGTALLNLERYEEAVSSYDKALQAKPDYPEALLNRGTALVFLERMKEAEQSFRVVLEQFPNNWQALLGIVLTLPLESEWSESLAPIRSLLFALDGEIANQPFITDLLIEVAANGYAAEVLQQLIKTSTANYLEPLVIGIKIFLGEQPLVAQEILAVGQDVAQRIREQQKALKESKGVG
jgi:tetratricopeptide (TPR) repeat protein